MFLFYVNMHISNQVSSTSFTSTPLKKVYLRSINKNGEEKLIKGMYTKLTPEDINSIKEISQNWQVPHGLAQDFYRDFNFYNFISPDTKQSFNAVELISKKPLKEKILGLMHCYTSVICGEKSLCGNTIFVNPNLSTANKNRNIKGIGEILLGNFFSQAKRGNVDYANFTSSSSAVSFYRTTLKKAGIKVSKNNYFNKDRCRFSIPQNEFDKYIQYCQKKYNTDLSQKT